MGSYIISLHLTETYFSKRPGVLMSRKINKQQERPETRQTDCLKVQKITLLKKLNDYRNNPKKFWEQIKSTYPTDKNQNPIRLSDTEGNILNNNQTATLVNEYFTNIGPDLANTARNMVRN